MLKIPKGRYAQFSAEIAKLLETMSDPERLQILRVVIEQEASMRSLSGRLGLSQSATYHHLAELERAGVVKTRVDAQTTLYSSTSTAAKTIIDKLDEIF